MSSVEGSNFVDAQTLGDLIAREPDIRIRIHCFFLELLVQAVSFSTLNSNPRIRPDLLRPRVARESKNFP